MGKVIFVQNLQFSKEFIYSFTKYLLSNFHVPGPVLEAGDAAVSKKECYPE